EGRPRRPPQHEPAALAEAMCEALRAASGGTNRSFKGCWLQHDQATIADLNEPLLLPLFQHFIHALPGDSEHLSKILLRHVQRNVLAKRQLRKLWTNKLQQCAGEACRQRLNGAVIHTFKCGFVTQAHQPQKFQQKFPTMVDDRMKRLGWYYQKLSFKNRKGIVDA